MIRTVIFDIGLVLIGFDWHEYINDLYDGETADRISHALWGAGHWPELDRGVIPEEEIFEMFVSEAPDLRDEIWEAFDRVGEGMTRRDWAIPLIDSLKEKGYQVLFLSNLSKHVISRTQHILDFIPHTDGGIYSCDVKAIKPDPEIYQLLIDRYDLVPEECLFIDDHEENLAAARRFGIKGIRFTDYEQMRTDLERTLSIEATQPKTCILCYGDSNTFGFDPSNKGRYSPEKRWTNILAGRLGDRYEVINAGLNGRTTAYDRPGAPWKNGASSLAATIGMHKPVHMIVLMLGTNDCVAGIGLTAPQIEEGMEKLASIIYETTPGMQGYVPDVVIVSPPPLLDDSSGAQLKEEITEDAIGLSRELAALYRELAAKHGFRFVDAAEAEMSLHDGEHLTEQGHRQIAGLMEEAILHPDLSVRSGPVRP